MPSNTDSDSFAISSAPIVEDDRGRVSEAHAAADELPTSYERPLLVVIARDPHTLFAYWDIDWAKTFANQPPPDRAVHLRVFEDEKEEASIAVEPLAGSSYVTVSQADARYTVELGYYDAARAWQSVATSDSVITPRNSIAGTSEFQLVTVPLHLEFQRLVEIFRGPRFDGASLTSALADLQNRADTEPASLSEDERTLLDRIDWRAFAEQTDERDSIRSGTQPADAVMQARWQRILGVGLSPSSAGSS